MGARKCNFTCRVLLLSVIIPPDFRPDFQYVSLARGAIALVPKAVVRLGHQAGAEGHVEGVQQMRQDRLYRVTDIFASVTEDTHHTIAGSRLPAYVIRRRLMLRLAWVFAWLLVQITPFGFVVPIDGAAREIGQA